MFGSYDPKTIASGEQLNMFQTHDTKTWNVKADRAGFGKSNLPAATRLVSIEPQVEYVYIPDKDF